MWEWLIGAVHCSVLKIRESEIIWVQNYKFAWTRVNLVIFFLEKQLLQESDDGRTRLKVGSFPWEAVWLQEGEKVKRQLGRN